MNIVCRSDVFKQKRNSKLEIIESYEIFAKSSKSVHTSAQRVSDRYFDNPV